MPMDMIWLAPANTTIDMSIACQDSNPPCLAIMPKEIPTGMTPMHMGSPVLIPEINLFILHTSPYLLNTSILLHKNLQRNLYLSVL